MKSWRKELGKALKSYRKQAGLRQSDIQVKTDIPRQVVSEIENGKFSGAISTIEKYMLLADLEFKVVVKADDFPQLDELDALFGEDND